MQQEWTRAQTLPGGEEAVLLIHGFTGTPAQLLPMAQRLQQAGYTVRLPLLRGHGLQKPTDMEGVRWKDWLEDMRQEARILSQRHTRVYGAGLSMGATLTLLLAQEGLVDKAISMAAPIRIYSRLTPLSKVLWPLVRTTIYHGRTQLQDFLHEYDLGYCGMPVRCVKELTALMRRAESGLSRVICPILVVSPQKDTTVIPVSGQMIYQGVSSRQKELLLLEKSCHVCTLDCERDLLYERAVAFLRQT